MQELSTDEVSKNQRIAPYSEEPIEEKEHKMGIKMFSSNRYKVAEAFSLMGDLKE